MEDTLKNLIYNICKVDVNKMTPEERDDPLLSKRFGVMPYQIRGLFVRIEEIFKITVTEEAIIMGKFNSYNGILNVISANM